MPAPNKAQLGRFGRSFALMLNRTLMYEAKHPYIKQSVTEVMTVATPLLDSISPLVFIYNRGNFYIDDEMLDPRININRIAALFKASGLQSVSFENGLMENELLIFAELFSGLTKSTSADSIKEDLIYRGVFNIRINHVVFKKVTEHDQVVSRDALKNVTPFLDTEDQQQRKQFLEALMESVLAEELASTLNITNLMSNPQAFTRKMIEVDLAGALQLEAGLTEDSSGDSASSNGSVGHSGGTAGSALAYSGHAEPAQETPRSAHAQNDSPGAMQQASGSAHGDHAHPGAVYATSGSTPAHSTNPQPSPGLHGTSATPQTAAHPSIGDSAAEHIAREGHQQNKEGTSAPTSTQEDQGDAVYDHGVSVGSGAGPGSGGSAGGSGANRGILLLHQIEVMHQEVEKHLQGEGQVSLSDLTNSIFEMKKHLLESIQAQKALGLAFANESDILSAADKLTDKVILELVKEEYKAGAVSPQRMAHLIVRLVPEAAELKRLLPQIKQCLLQEGMPPSDYLKLIQALREELQSEELTRILQESSEAIGLDGDMLIEEVKQNPAQAAELIYLASEIRRGGADENTLSDILVEYVERLGHQIAEKSGEGADHVKQVMADVESNLLKKLSGMNVNESLLKRMEDRLHTRMESILDNMRVQWLHSQPGGSVKEKVKMLSVLQTLENNVSRDEELSAILMAVRTKVEAGEIEENNFIQIHEEIVRQQELQRARESDQDVPVNVLSSDEFMFILEKEIARAQRYDSPFSVLAFAFVKATPKLASLQDIVTSDAILESALKKLSDAFRTSDFVGRIGKNKIIALLPMAYPEEGKKTLARILRLLHAGPLDVRGVPVQLRVAGVYTGYDVQAAQDAKAFVKMLSEQLVDMVTRIKSIQVLF
jgi:GGDEF domain-containing protein